MAKKIALGKGIASLISETPNPVIEESLKNLEREELKQKLAANDNTVNTVSHAPLTVKIADIQTNPNQPRKIFKEKELEELSASIKENGVIQPVIVVKNDNGYELVAGERRLRASKKAGLKEIPAVIRRATDKEKMVMAIIENVQRSDLNCVEEALAYYQLMEEFQLTQEEVAKKLGKERSSVANFLRILKLPRDVVELLQKELLSFGHAKVLAGVKEREHAIRLANTAVAEKLSVRELEKLSKKKNTVSEKKEVESYYNKEKLDMYKQKLEQKTGFHFQIKDGKKGSGELVLKFNNEAEFNDIYEYLLN